MSKICYVGCMYLMTVRDNDSIYLFRAKRSERARGEERGRGERELLHQLSAHFILNSRFFINLK